MFPSVKAREIYDTPPVWAVLERQLFNAINDAAPRVLERYTRPDGMLLWPTRSDFKSIDALDDCYESFHNWPLFYLLGGADRFLTDAQREFDIITESMAQYDTGFGYPMVVNEYQPGYDWFHQGEGNYLFYMLCMADPSHRRNIDRACRFAGFYLNEDQTALNYNPEHRIIRCVRNGSKGPAFWTFTAHPYWPWPGYNLPFYDVPGCTSHEAIQGKPELAARLGRAMMERQGKGDAVTNLAATSLVMNAFLLTGEPRYQKWVEEYVEAWVDHARRNGGIVPDNVGLSGQVGEHMNGRWYGAHYGWTWPHGWHSVGQAVGIAAQNLSLLTRDVSPLDFARSQVDALIQRGIDRDGHLFVPYKYGDPGRISYEPGAWLQYPLKNTDGTAVEVDGWFEFMPMHPSDVAHLWCMSSSPQDWERFTQIRNRPGSKLDIGTWYHTKDQGGHDGAWLAYLGGEYQEYPEDILTHNLRQVQQRIEFMENDTEDASQYRDSYFQRRNPVTCEGLVQLTLGAPLPHYNGGLLVAPLRYFDTERGRPGLPTDVSALVSARGEGAVQLQLVNLSKTHQRQLVIQAGGMAEHTFTDLVADRETVPVHGTCVQINLPPRHHIQISLGMAPFTQAPSYRSALL